MKIMKKFLAALTVVFVLSLLLAGTAFAIPPSSRTKDTLPLYNNNRRYDGLPKNSKPLKPIITAPKDDDVPLFFIPSVTDWQEISAR